MYCTVLLKVCHGIDRSVVNWDLVTMEPGTDQDDKLNNAKYAISVARKLGACVFVASEDIVQVKSKMIMLFCASLWHCENERTVGPPSTENSTVGVQATRIPQVTRLDSSVVFHRVLEDRSRKSISEQGHRLLRDSVLCCACMYVRVYVGLTCLRVLCQ